jgi:hypothetical protein
MTLCATQDELKAIGKEITPKLKAQMLPADVAAMREKYLACEQEVTNGKQQRPAERETADYGAQSELA